MVSFANVFSPISNLMGDQKNPADAAMPYLDQAGSSMKKYAQPYINRGDEFSDPLMQKYQSMMDDPAAFLQSLMGGYEESDWYNQMLESGGTGADAAAAAGGYKGTTQDIRGQADMRRSLKGEDMQRYMNNLMGIQDKGVTGGQGFYDTGYKASSGLSSDLSNLYGTQGSLAFQGQREDNQRQQDMMKALMQLMGGAAGGAMGGPAGAAAGSSAAGGFF